MDRCELKFADFSYLPTYWDDAEVVEMRVDPMESDELLELANHYGSDKGDKFGAKHNYVQHYQRYFFPLRQRHLKILEIGIARGSSLKMWASFFPNAIVDGIDINPKCANLCKEFPNINLLIGDAKNFDFGNRRYDIVIDDGSHLASDIVQTWENLRSNTHDRTIYILEDIHSTLDKAYIAEFHAKRGISSGLNSWFEINGQERLATFLYQLAERHQLDVLEDKLVFITRREESIADGDNISFSFGENWLDFLDSIDDQTISLAREDVDDWLYDWDLQDKSAIDIGCGSGLSSLALMLSGCGRILSIDSDPKSVAATLRLREKYPEYSSGWEIREGSILDSDLVSGLPKFDLVYSWGVLHHTGNMWRALESAKVLCKVGGLLWISIYSGGNRFAQDLELKRLFNAATSEQRERMIQARIDAQRPQQDSVAALGEERGDRKERGMDIFHDAVDWLGGLPYEVARVSEILVFFVMHGFTPLRVMESPQGGCSIYLFKREESGKRIEPNHLFTYGCTWSKLKIKRAVMEQIVREFSEADYNYNKSHKMLSEQVSAAIRRAVDAEGRLNSGRHLLRYSSKWLMRKFHLI